jgi:diguanylate cyclase (GGDEF)-like protein
MQERLEEQNKELLAGREELESQNQELISLKVELEAQNEELVLSHETLEDLNLRLHALAATDGLTGLMNHRTFQEEIRREWSSSLPGSLSLLLLDVDHFKSYNDTYGHQCGDEILITLGQTLQSLARDGDIVARYGGEEFAAILHGADAAAAAHAAERFRSAIELHDWPRRPITASIGVATLSADMTGPQDLIRAADNALYYSKEQGRNRVSCASDLNDHKVIAA